MSQETMKCVLVSAHGDDIDKLISMSQVPKPMRKKGEVLVKVQACALAPGDIRVMKGHCDFFQEPRSFPYIPGGDFSGIVEEVDEGSHFKKGDAVMVVFESPRPLDGLAEYACAKEALVELKPKAVGAAEAACLTSSALTAWNATNSFVKAGDRVLILGASGGVGTFLVQLAKNAGASYIVATSTDEELLVSLGVDRVINYREENWWEVTEFQENPFDLVFDLGVGRKEAWKNAKGVLKNGLRGGRYVTLSGDEPEMKIHNWMQTLVFFLGTSIRGWQTKIWRWSPTYIHFLGGLDIKPGCLEQIAKLVDNGKLKVVFDPTSPLPFTIDAVRQGFHLMNSRHSHGKTVITVSSTRVN